MCRSCPRGAGPAAAEGHLLLSASLGLGLPQTPHSGEQSHPPTPGPHLPAPAWLPLLNAHAAQQWLLSSLSLQPPGLFPSWGRRGASRPGTVSSDELSQRSGLAGLPGAKNLAGCGVRGWRPLPGTAETALGKRSSAQPALEQVSQGPGDTAGSGTGLRGSPLSCQERVLHVLRMLGI